MNFLLLNITELIYYIIIVFCLVIIAVILLKYWSIRKEENERVVVRKIEDPDPLVKEEKVLNEEQPEEEFSSELEGVLKQMQDSLETGKDVTQIFEEEQEEKAIISYQELVRANLKQEIKEPVSKPKDVLEPIIENIDEEIPILDSEFSNPKKEEKKFKHTDFISPIYGTMDARSIPRKTKIEEARDIDIEKTLNLTGLSEEKKKNAEFLRSLKEFRNNL